MKICVTGHRPNKLYGYDLNNKQYRELKDKMKSILIDKKCTEAITGMALGTDMLFAMAVIELKHEGYDIKLHCAIPCLNHTSKWVLRSVKLYEYILSHADKIKIVTEEPYSLAIMQIRNEYMVDLADEVIAVWDGSKGGTANCVRYAERVHKPVTNLL